MRGEAVTIELLQDYRPEPEVAKALNVAPVTMYRWRNRPDGLPYLELGGRIHYHVPTVRQWIEDHLVRRPNPRPRGRGK